MIHRWRTFLIATALFLVPMAAWALASPIGSVPDEPSHAIRAAAVVRGQLTPPPWEENTALGTAEVPRYIAHLHERTCYVFQPSTSAGCVIPVSGDPDELVTTGTSATANTPVYYALVGWPTLFLSGDVAIYAMRMVSALLCALALGIAVMQLSSLERSRWPLIGLVAAATPMVLYLAGAVNPNGLEAASSAGLFATLLAAFRSDAPARLTWERVGLVAILVALLANTRSIALLWVLVILAAALLLGERGVIVRLLRTRPAWVLIAGSAAIALVSALAYVLPKGYDPVLADVRVSPIAAFVSVLGRTFEFGAAFIGEFGWLDTPSPAYTALVWSAAIVALVLGAAVLSARVQRATAIGLLAVVLVGPAVIQAVIAPTVGIIWQGRYSLALFVVLMIGAGVALGDRFGDGLAQPARRILQSMLVLLAIGQVFSFVWVLRRYTVGAEGPVTTMLLSPEWQPPLGWIPLTLVLALAIAAATAFAWRLTTDRPAVTA